ncbi:Cupin 2, conserved barrel domain protein [Candidatus Sulfopaludibacter sp. SbA4]|nr:Cupin 2, conserved barrel domain protein [Candidatus Sulfopaludibacter sp. SbA4]
MKHYGWNQMEQEQLNPKVGRRAIHGTNVTIARLEIQKDATVPEHSHVNEQVTMVERGALQFSIEGREQIVRAGEVLVIPPHAPHGVVALEDTIVVDMFSPAREDWIRGDDAYLRR